MGGTVGALPTPEEMNAEMGGKPWSWSHSGPTQFSPFKDMMPDLGRRTNQFSTGGTIEGPGGPTDDMVPAIVDGVDPVWLSDGERVQKASTRDWLGEKFFVDLDKKADKERAEYEATQGGKPKSVMPMPMPENKGAPGYADGGTIERIANAATRARLREQDAGLSPDPYGPTLNDSPVFQPAPRQTGQQPANVFASPLPEVQPVARTAPSPMPLPMPAALPTQDEMRARAQLEAQRADPMPMPMKPAPLTMTEQERMFTPARPARTPVAEPAFEAALTGLSGMEKRKARAALTMEEATFARDQGRADAAARVAEARAQQNREQDFAEWQQKQVIGDQFQQAAENRRMGVDAVLTGEQRKYQEGRSVADREEQARRAKNFTDVPDTDYKINDLGNLISKKTGRPVGLSPEDATKYGLEIAGADSEGRVRYAPAKAKTEVRRFYDPANAKIVELGPDEMPPEGSGWKPIQRQAQAAAPAAPEKVDGGTVSVTSADQWAKLKPGTRYTTPDGRVGTKK